MSCNLNSSYFLSSQIPNWIKSNIIWQYVFSNDDICGSRITYEDQTILRNIYIIDCHGEFKAKLMRINNIYKINIIRINVINGYECHWRFWWCFIYLVRVGCAQQIFLWTNIYDVSLSVRYLNQAIQCRTCYSSTFSIYVTH